MARGIVVGLILPGAAVVFSLYLMSQHADLLPEQKTILINGLNRLVMSFLFISAILVVVNALFGIFISQRFAGPLTRIETWSIQHLMNEKPAPLKVREKDELGSIVKALNKIISKYDEDKSE
jgi:hypothetical protein